ncbi:ATP12 family chaperone protein [Vannielia litorea]|uniref:Chaperone required for the assembly of the F1-ATPase n=1 Tax=Vannielia litorea TaxID=1217970 RepID=A0A1N6IBH8_9RHOB|nr:ATP12 family protein [Vannielia litorea]SIO29362.1 Chaperone required for the assembly of the F1-ATPase [Vannielia litorea]
MAEWAAKRFWKAAEAVPVEGGFAVQLDGRPVKTPAKAPLLLPTEALAWAVAAEWEAQGERIDPLSMPFTRSANSALDRVAPQQAEVAEIVAAYGETDLICYRAAEPRELAALQAEAWNPLIDWARDVLDAPLIATEGLMHVPQPATSVEALRARVVGQDAFALTALHDLTALSGSLVIGLAVQAGQAAPEALWDLSRVDENWQIAQWGDDEEAAEVAARKRGDFLHAAEVYRLSRPVG